MRRPLNEEFRRMQKLAGITIKNNIIKESSSPYTIVWQRAYHGGAIFITQNGKQIQDKIMSDIQPDLDEEYNIEKNVDTFTQHSLYPSYKKEIDETIDLIHDNITYLNKDSDFIQKCLQDLNEYNSEQYMYSRIGCIMMLLEPSVVKDLRTFIDRPNPPTSKYFMASQYDVFVELLEETKYLNFKEMPYELVPVELGGDDLYLDYEVGMMDNFYGSVSDI
jgi:hypothetical protein